MDGFAVGALVEIVAPEGLRINWTVLRPGMRGVVLSAPRLPKGAVTWANVQDVLFGCKIRTPAIPLLREILPPPREEIEEEDDATV